MDPPSLKRNQHKKFGEEIRALLNSKLVEDKELAGIVLSELMNLCKQKAAGKSHPKEERLTADLHEIGYLKLYNSGFSIRAYYCVIDGVIWMLSIDKNKRRTTISDSFKVTLLQRVSDVKLLSKRTRK